MSQWTESKLLSGWLIDSTTTSGSSAVIISTRLEAVTEILFIFRLSSDENITSIFVVKTFCYECNSRNSGPRFSFTSEFLGDTDSDNAVPCTTLIAWKL